MMRIICISLLLFGLHLFAPAISRGEGPLRIVATGGRMGHDSVTITTNTAFWHRSPHVLGGPVDEIQIGLMNWLHGYTDEVVSTTDVTIAYAWLERASTGQVVPLTFGGNRQFVMPANSLQAYFPSDPIPSTVWTGAPPARDDLFWVQVKGRVATNANIYLGSPTTWSGAKFINYYPGNDPGTYDTTGAVPTIVAASARVRGLPLVFTGRFSAPGYLSVIGIGDSILDGTGDTANPVPTIAGYGFFNRAALDVSNKNAIAVFNLTRHGSASSVWNNPIRMPKFLKLANVIVEEYGTNDIGQNGTGNTDQLKARLHGIWNRARTSGVQKVVRTLLLPRTDTTNEWRTKEGQTPNTGWGAGGKRDTMNDFFYASQSSGNVDVVVNILDTVADPTDNHYWMTNGAPELYNTDSTHLDNTGNAACAPVLRAALLSLNVDTNVDTYAQWTNRVAWGAADSSPGAAPNHDGLSNIEAYAHDLSPLDAVGGTNLPSLAVDVTSTNGPWMVYTYRRNATAGDMSYRFFTSEDLMNAPWLSLFVNSLDVVEELVDANPDGDGSAQLVKLKVKVPPSLAGKFLMLDVDI